MSVKIILDNLSEKDREKIIHDLTIHLESDKKIENIELFNVENNHVVLPFAYGILEMHLPKPKSADFYKLKNPMFAGALRDEQKTIKDESIQKLNLYGACLISCFPGFGKTITSIYLASKIGLKTLIIVHRIALIHQWQESIKQFCPHATTIILTKKNVVMDEVDFVIVNAINVKKFGSSFFNGIGTVIVDEAHLIMSKILSQSLGHLFPKYLIGLSATPYRPDGLNVLLEHYFTKEKIIRTLRHPHVVYKIETQFFPTVEYDRFGKLIWGKIIESQSLDPARNALICKIIQKHSDRNFLVLTKRVEQAHILFDMLQHLGFHVDTLIESKTEFDRDARILIGTTSKVGVGFDHASLDALILASDLEEYFVQYLGRVFRRQDIVPIVFDLVDNHNTLKRHFQTRKSVYLECGGKIEKYIL